MPESERTLQLDFSQCIPQKERVYITYGSYAYELVGKKDGFCTLRYGGEVENPNWENLTTVCRVPESVGSREFVVKDLGVNFSPISEYCRETSLVVTNRLDPLSVAVGVVLIGMVVAGVVLAIKKIRTLRR